MTYIDPGQPAEFPEPQNDQPDIDPAGVPDEMPPAQPGGGDEGDSRTFDAKAI
ncbi:MAG TPA: hypothetical protein VF633_05630 [Brevundimonas sp.]|jgi:hypothetical protein